jgi:hypothetical protein
VTRFPLARLSYGLKLEGSMNFKNEAPSDASAFHFSFHPYSRYMAFGPYFKYEVARKVNLGAELWAQPTHYENDGVGENERSGRDILGRLYLQADWGNRYFNPTLAIRFDKNEANGTEYRSLTNAIDLSTMMHLPMETDLTMGLTLTRVDYSEKPVQRNDRSFTLRVVGSKKLTRHWTILGNADHTDNTSNLDTQYAYKRTTILIGASYTF